MYLKN